MNDQRDQPKVTPLQDADAAALAALYHAHAQETPPAHLDETILSAARAATQQPARPRSRRWLPALGGLAASVLVVMVSFQLLPPANVDPDTPAVLADHAQPAEHDAAESKLAAQAPPPPAAPARQQSLATNQQPESAAASPSSQPSAIAPSDDPPALMERKRHSPLAPNSEEITAAKPDLSSAPEQPNAALDAVSPAPAQQPVPMLREIETLWRAHQTDQALKRFADFEQSYPNFVIPSEYRPLIAQLRQAQAARGANPPQRDTTP